jgi:hypothetical protein
MHCLLNGKKHWLKKEALLNRKNHSLQIKYGFRKTATL